MHLTQRSFVARLCLRNSDKKLAGGFGEPLTHRIRRELTSFERLHIIPDRPRRIAQPLGILRQLQHCIDFGLIAILNQPLQLLQQLQLLFCRQLAALEHAPQHAPALVVICLLARASRDQPFVNTENALPCGFQRSQGFCCLSRCCAKFVAQHLGELSS